MYVNQAALRENVDQTPTKGGKRKTEREGEGEGDREREGERNRERLK